MGATSYELLSDISIMVIVSFFFYKKFIKKNLLPVQQLKFYFFLVSLHIMLSSLICFPLFIYLFILVCRPYGLPASLNVDHLGLKDGWVSSTHLFLTDFPIYFRRFSGKYCITLILVNRKHMWLNLDFFYKAILFKMFVYVMMFIHYFHSTFRARFIFFLL